MASLQSIDPLVTKLREILRDDCLMVEDAISIDYFHDESLGTTPVPPRCLVYVTSTLECAQVIATANDLKVPVTARGSGSGLSGGALPIQGGIVISFEKMNQILEIDTQNHTATLEAGVTLEQLELSLAEVGFVYPVYPGEMSATIGGNVATNAGGMRAVKYGVTRHNVLGVEFVTATGDVISSGGKFVKSSSGYDLTQLVIGSEGTLALVTKVIVAITPIPQASVTLLIPFDKLSSISVAIPEILRSNCTPSILEYVDAVGLKVMASREGLDLGLPKAIQDEARAYLICMLEEADPEGLEKQQLIISNQMIENGALDVYELSKSQALRLLRVREAAFWVTKELGATDIVDIVVPRAQIPNFMDQIDLIAQEYGTIISAVGHAGDGNIHLSIFENDHAIKGSIMSKLYRIGLDLGGAISAEHGIGTAKRPYFLDLEDPTKLELMRRIKYAFDPNGILNPGKVL